MTPCVECRYLPPLPLSQDGKNEVAVKVIQKSFMKKEPKLKENLYRETQILRLIAETDCDYVVKLLGYQVSSVQVRGVIGSQELGMCWCVQE